MSSILDALRKLEQEKAVREQAAPTTPLQELTLEPELELGRERAGASSIVRMGFLVVVGVAVLGGIGAGLFAGASIFLRREAPVGQVAAKAPVEAAAVTTTVKPVDVAPVADDAEPEKQVPVKVASAAVPKPTPTKKADVAPKPAAPAPAPAKPAPPVQPAQTTVAATVTPSNAEGTAKADIETDVEKLPILSESVRVRLGLPALKINIVGIPNNRNPRASALINMQKVYVGENIPGTSARLMDVSLRGVALDINGQRYFLSRR
ncbi:MAG: hypothetical protein HUU46_17770 [Candidatus Hydrogenedentes bacterium]|nr:hypothetical protein [Candidatus Hydrogenedentota bacterium]